MAENIFVGKIILNDADKNESDLSIEVVQFWEKHKTKTDTVGYSWKHKYTLWR